MIRINIKLDATDPVDAIRQLEILKNRIAINMLSSRFRDGIAIIIKNTFSYRVKIQQHD